MKRLLLLPLFLFAGPSLAQVADTTAPARYFPAGLGDTWEYVRTGGVPGLSWLERRTIVGDTLVAGESYVRYLVERFDDEAPHAPLDEGFTWLLRYDPETAALTTTEPPLPALTGCPLDTPFGAELMCPDDCFTSTFGGIEEAEIGGETVETSVKYFDSQACEITGGYAADVGFLGYDTFGGSLRLGYARVGGTTIGTPVLPPVEDGGAYFPLEIGAVWEYVGDGLLTGTVQRRSIVGDTLIEGTSYVRYRVEDFDAETGSPTAPAATYPLRYDALTASLDAPEGLPFGVTPCPLDAVPPDTLSCGGCTVTVSGGEEEILIGTDAVTATLKHYDSQACEILGHYAEGLGFLGYRLRAAGFELAYVRVGDIELGTPVLPTVDTEPPPPSGDLTLTAAPNPAAGPITLWIDLTAAQSVRVDVFDAAGRRVAVLHNGALSAGRHPLTFGARLPTGTYVVRAAGDRAQANHRITLVR